MCGEKLPMEFLIPLTKGSPPHVRGKVNLRLTVCGLNWDHPRMCGEKGAQRTAEVVSLGSPPHVRGKEFSPAAEYWGIRITPACAGKSRQTGGRNQTVQDHPRMCGEKAVIRSSQLSKRGSPPHVRGKAPMSPDLPHTRRITPACAGKRSPPSCGIM